MGKKTSTTAIGAFVIGAIALTVISVIVFGSGKLFATTVPCVFYFKGSVQGLSVGSPVKFKGSDLWSNSPKFLPLKEVQITKSGAYLRIPLIIWA